MTETGTPDSIPESGLIFRRENVPGDTTCAAGDFSVSEDNDKLVTGNIRFHHTNGGWGDVTFQADFTGADQVVIEAGDYLPEMWPPEPVRVSLVDRLGQFEDAAMASAQVAAHAAAHTASTHVSFGDLVNRLGALDHIHTLVTALDEEIDSPATNEIVALLDQLVLG